MEGNSAKVLARSCRVYADVKKRKASGLASGKSLYRCYSNLMKTRMPCRLMCFHNDEWVDLPTDILGLIRKDLELKKGVIEVNHSGCHLLLDFLHMVQLDVKTGLEQPIAWIDEAGCCFFPEVFAYDDVRGGCCQYYSDKDDSYLLSKAQGQHEIVLQTENELNGVNDTKIVEDCGDANLVVKRVKVGQVNASRHLEAEVDDNCDRVSCAAKKIEDLEENFDVKIQPTDETLTSEDVAKMFLKGMSPADGVDIIDISQCSGSVMQARMELFQKQVEIMKMYRGHANVRYAWLAASEEELLSIMAYGLGPLGLSKFKSFSGIGVHLSDVNCSGTSVKYCDGDENGVRCMILCSVIMGNMEMIDPGSKQYHPNSENFDNGVDDLDNPQQYFVWSVNINTHIHPKFVVSFKISPVKEELRKVGALQALGSFVGWGSQQPQPRLLGQGYDGVLVSTKLEIATAMTGEESTVLQPNVSASVSSVDVSDHKSNVPSYGYKGGAVGMNSGPERTFKSSFTPFPILFAAIAGKISSDDMKAIHAHYELYRTAKVARVDFVRTLRAIIGDPLLRSTFYKLQSRGVLENKSSTEVPKLEDEG